MNSRVINEDIQLVPYMAAEKKIPELHAVIYSFNDQSQRMFESVGFVKTDDEKYVLSIKK